tara:strand:- start:1405 stop:2301 length:897 start_codon:yes stop_codon:yes gene_type:complete
MNVITRRKQSLLGVFWIAIFTAFWGLIERLGMGIAETYHFSQIVFMRYVVHLLALLLICLLYRVRRPLQSARPTAQWSRGICMWFMPMSFIVVVTVQSGANLWAMFWTMPLFVALLARLTLAERQSIFVWTLLIVGFIAMCLVLGVDPMRVTPSTFLPVLGGLSFAAYVVLSRSLRDEALVTGLIYTGLVPMLAMLPFALLYWQAIQPGDVLRIVAIGLVGLASLYCLDRALQHVSATWIAPLLFGAVVSELLIEFLRSATLPDATQISGSLLLLLVATILIGSTLFRKDSHVEANRQ